MREGWCTVLGGRGYRRLGRVQTYAVLLSPPTEVGGATTINYGDCYLSN